MFEPVTRAPRALAPRTPTTSAGGVDALRILYIDDDASNRAVVRAMLRSVGVAIAEAGDARSGLRAIDEGDHHVVLMDLRMPGFNGLTAIRQLRTTRSSERLRVAVLTADLTTGVKALCEKAGADDFLEKPVDMGKLLDVVAAATLGSRLLHVA